MFCFNAVSLHLFNFIATDSKVSERTHGVHNVIGTRQYGRCWRRWMERINRWKWTREIYWDWCKLKSLLQRKRIINSSIVALPYWIQPSAFIRILLVTSAIVLLLFLFQNRKPKQKIQKKQNDMAKTSHKITNVHSHLIDKLTPNYSLSR